MGKVHFERNKPHINVSPWIFVAAAVIVGGGIVAAAILYPGKDRATEVGANATPKATASAKPQRSEEPSASPEVAVVGQSSGDVEPAGGDAAGRTSIATVSGEFAESSEGQDQIEAEREADAAEAELERESDEQKADEREAEQDQE